ncbi:F-box protein [Rosa sericea]
MDLEGKLEAEAEDRISELPDAILCHILSFLPTTFYAVRTTILSTRWKNVWTSVPNLVFEDREFPERFEAFMMFVDRVFSLRNNSSNILKFRFLGGSNVEEEDVSRIDRWICTAVRGNVVELDLEFYSGTFEFKMPQSVFICKTLVTLRVESDCISYAPPSTSGLFPSLKLLDFTAFNDYSTSLVKLFPLCSVLEDLVIGINGYDKNVRISAPELKTLRIHSPWDEVIEFFY